MTNNVAEYHALIRLLSFVDSEGLFLDEIYGDSLLIINMATGRWGSNTPHKNAPHLRPLCLQARALLKKLSLPVSWIPRERNEIADALSKLD